MPHQEDGGYAAGLALQVVLPPYQLDVLAERVADLLEERQDDGFVGAVPSRTRSPRTPDVTCFLGGPRRVRVLSPSDQNATFPIV